ncbi:hypothetical protein Q5P01_022532 [Channa striata]|uniref:G-protein coupled receptors family 1 profile domain-containing protein n=1 Tax=Channa striata TaxID=64152 RepID=A0AA88JCX9_CHASR|nr:hypothetical protein Q5P01_022532 [Channa striata]
MEALDENTAFHSNIPVLMDTAVAVVYSSFGALSLFGNSLLLYACYKKRHRLKPAEYFIINLAVSDLGLTLFLYPLAVTSSFYHSFFAAWSPYAVVSMWAAFGHIDNIPPLAFAVPAMFAKSSTIYNPIIYLILRPNIRRMMRRDLATFCHCCLKFRLCSQRQLKCCSKPKVSVGLRTIQREADQFPSSDSSARPPTTSRNDQTYGKCKDATPRFRHDPQTCGVTNNHSSSQDKHMQKTQSESYEKPQLAIVFSKRTSEIENVHMNVGMTPGYAKAAWS